MGTNLPKPVILAILDSLRELSDKEFQIRVWVNGDGPEVSSFTEAVCGLFDDTALGDLLDKNGDLPVLSPSADQKLRELHLQLKEFYGLNDSEIIKDQRWAGIRCLAKECADIVSGLCVRFQNPDCG